MKEEILHGNYSVFSDAMSSLIQKTLNEHNQMIILLNRRGYNTFVMCRDCGETIMCPHCDVAMVYHQAGEELRCHYCEHHEQFLQYAQNVIANVLSSLAQAHKRLKKNYDGTLSLHVLLDLIKM